MLTTDDFKYFIRRLMDYANEAIAESRANKKDDFLAGKRMAYFEMISTLQSDLRIEDQDLAEFGLDFDSCEILDN